MKHNQLPTDTTTAPYVAVVKMMAGLRLSLLNSQNSDLAGAQAQRELKPGDQLVAVFGIDEPFVNQLEQQASALAPGYAGKGSATSTIPWLGISARPDGELELDVMAAPSTSAALQKLIAYNSISGNEDCALLSLEPVIFTAMKKFRRERQEFDIKIM